MESNEIFLRASASLEDLEVSFLQTIDERFDGLQKPGSTQGREGGGRDHSQFGCDGVEKGWAGRIEMDGGRKIGDVRE